MALRRTACRIRRTSCVAAALAVLLANGADADLVANIEDTGVRTAVADKSDEALIAANPALEQLGQESPALLDEVLERLRSAAPEASWHRGLTQDQPKPVTPSELTLLAENPDLSEYYRESPEAALDLLRLIREAAKKQ